METNNDSPNPIREDAWDEAAEENYPQELTEVLQAADVAEQLEQAQEEEYTPDWDGTDAEFVEDEDAAEYEEQYAGIKLSYTLNREEAMACLKRAHIYKTVGRRAWLETGILIVAAALFFVSFGLYQGGYNLALGILSLAVAAAVWLVPYLDMRKRAGEIAGGRKIEVEIYPDEVVVGSGEGQWEIPLDGTSSFEEFDDLMVLFTPKNAILAMPMRAMEPAVIADIQGMLIAGCIPEKR